MKINQIKICGMKYVQNINQNLQSNPNFIGFIFYTSSSRTIEAIFPMEKIINIKKIGVFVFIPNSCKFIYKYKQKYILDFIQLHGYGKYESCKELYSNNFSLIKVFRIKTFISYNEIQKYINYSIYFLFDTYSKKFGGSGKKFSWKKIAKYSLATPFFISGGIGKEDIEKIIFSIHTRFFGIDLNSKFEVEPLNKNRDELRRFIHKIKL